MTQLILDEERGVDTAMLAESQPPQAMAVSPLTLLQTAVENGMSPEQLKALVDLHEQWRAARAKEAFAAALNLCQAEMPCMVRDGENGQTRSRYIRLETITHGAKPVYVRHGFALCFSEEDSAKEGFKRIVCDITHREGHSERRWLDLPIDGIGAKGNAIGAMNPVQGCISTGSYGQRVLICRIFNITIADTDLDGQTLHDNPEPANNAPRERTRAKRQEPTATAVSVAQLGHITAEWKSKNLDPMGDVNRQRAAFAEWARKITKRTQDFDPTKLVQWAIEDYHACCDALNIPTLEDLQRDGGR